MLEFVLPGVSNQLHLLGRPGPSGESPTNVGATDIRRVYQLFNFVKYSPDYFLKGFFVDFTHNCGNIKAWAMRRFFRHRRDCGTGLSFIMFEELNLTQPLGGFFTCFIRPAEIFALFRRNFVSAFRFLDHDSPPVKMSSFFDEMILESMP